MFKIPKYIENELIKANEYAIKSSECIGKFEEWVRKNVDEDFDFEMLRGECCDITDGTEALTEIEYGNDVDIEAMQMAFAGRPR